MSVSHQFLKILGLSSVIFLTACGGESDSESDSSSDSGTGGSNSSSLAGTTSFSDSLVTGKRFFIASPQSSGVTDISTALFSSSGNTINWGEGYIDSADGSDYFLEEYSWSIDSGKMNVDGTGSIKSSSEDYLVVCFYEDNNSSDCDGDANNERWYLDKNKAKAYVTSSSTNGTSVNLNLITDSVLNAQFTSLEFDYIEQVEEINRPDADITSVAGLQQFTELEKLTLYENQITDISNLSALTNLERFHIDYQKNSSGSDVNLTSYDAIYSMKNLERLSLSQGGSNTSPTKFDLASFLNSHNSKGDIERLEFWEVPLTSSDITAIKGMSGLERLAMSDGAVANFDSWENNWSNLERLDIGWNNEPNQATFDLDAMINDGLSLSKLTRLEIANTTIDNDDLSTILAGVGSNLQRLDLRSTDITSYSSLFSHSSALSGLERIKLRLDGIYAAYDLAEHFAFMTKSNIRQLYLEDGDIFDLNLSDFTNLQKLQITGSNVDNLTISEFVSGLNALSNMSSLVIRSPGSRSTRIGDVAVTCSSLTGLSSNIDCTDS